MAAQVAPRPVGLVMGLQCTLHPFMGNPVFAEIAGHAARRAGRRSCATRRSASACSRPMPSTRPPRPALVVASRTCRSCTSSATRRTTSPKPEASLASRARARRRRPDGAGLRPAARRRRQGVPLPAGAQLRRRQPRRGRRDAGPPLHRARARRRRRPPRHHLRRQLPHDAPDALGPRSRPRPARPRRTWCSSTPATPPAPSACSTAASWPRATGPTSTSSTSRRLTARQPEIVHDLPGRRQAPGAGRRRLRRHRGRRPGHLRARRGDRAAARSPDPWPATRSRHHRRCPMTTTDPADLDAADLDLGGPVDPADLVPLEVECEWTQRDARRALRVRAHRHPRRRARRRARARRVGHRRRARHHPRRLPAADPRPRAGPSSPDRLIDGRRRRPDPRRAGRALRQGAGVGDLLGRRHAPRAARGRRTRRATCSATSPTTGVRLDDPTTRGNEIGGIAFPFHSDGSDLVGLFCLDAGLRGGASIVANAAGHPQRAGAHRARARRRAVRAVPVRPPRRAGPGRAQLVHDADLQPVRRPAVRPLHPALHRVVPAPRRRARSRPTPPGRR